MTDLDARLRIHSLEPLVGGPPLPLLREHFLTSRELFFIRNHAPVPEVDPDSFRLEVGGLVDRKLRLSLTELREGFPRVALAATLQCAGNRRNELMKVAPIPGEVAWGADGIGTALWRGVRLCDVLNAAGLAEGAAHVAFVGLDSVAKQGQTFGYGGSIPLEKALGREVLLADEMNGSALPPVHGFPLRVIVPGFIGARSVKWLGRIEVRSVPSDNYFQRAYRLFAPHIALETARPEDGTVLGENSLSAVICDPEPGASLAVGPVTIRGYALAGGNRKVARVDVSADGGRTWATANLEPDEPWTWQFWEIRLTLGRGPAELVARSWDTAGNTQPELLEAVWNCKGYMNNAWHRVPVTVG
jgi:sulfite oxidase